MKKIIAFIFGILVTYNLFGQDKIIIHYNQNWEITSPEDFQFRREAEINFSTIVFNGKFQDFNHGGKLIGEGQYLDGVKIGNHKTYFDDGTLKSSIDWKDGDFTLIEWKGGDPQFSVANGTGKFEVEYLMGSSSKSGRILRGVFKNRERVGKWIYSDSSGNPLYEETYNHGTFKRAIRYVKPDSVTQAQKKLLKESGWQVMPDEKEVPVPKLEMELSHSNNGERFDLDKTKYKNLYAFISQFKQYCDTLTNASIKYPGIGGYSSFIAKEMRYPAVARRYGVQGTSIVRVIVSNDGSVKSYKVLKTDTSTDVFDNEAMRVAKLLEDKWLPARTGCNPFESLINLPIVFKLR